VVDSLEVVQDMLGADGRPQREQVMMRIRQGAATPNGDETGIAVYRKDHGGHRKPQVALRIVPDSRSAYGVAALPLLARRVSRPCLAQRAAGRRAPAAGP
jgi:hypothetical protein